MSVLFSLIALIVFHSEAYGSKDEKTKMSRVAIKQGDTLSSILKKHSFSNHEIHKLLALKPLPPKYHLIPSEPYLYLNDSNEKRQGVKLFEQLTDKSYFLWKKPNGQVGFESLLEKFRKEVFSFNGRVVGGILTSIRNIIDSTWLAYRFLDAYVFDINPKRDLTRGAHFSMKVEKNFLGDQFVKYGQVLETSLEVNGLAEKRKFVAFGDGGLFLENNQQNEADKPLYAPVNYLRVSSPFQWHRFHPIRQRRVAHLGVDFEVPVGSEVLSALSGQVTRIEKNRASGNYIIIRHANGYETSYHHLNSVVPKLFVGKSVGDGELLGAVGCTGYCTSPHLHFGVKKHGKHIDPFKVLKRYPYQFAQRLLSTIEK
ncbi:MAG: M23 family metallopeptidase [Pseudomonadota bacterium]|nr:M23 family metallopeptidase [Pseudomonadota bacterium]